MDLNHRFRLDHNSKIALVGSGGKTTLMFQLARDFGTRVICTTTTHLALDQLNAADQYWVLNEPGDLPDAADELSGKILLFTGPQVEADRVGSPAPEILERLKELAQVWNCPMIIEADGARKLPIKAPAEHEPSIPDFIDTVITVIGLSGLGKPLTEEWVHRPQIYSALVDLPLGARLESEHLVKALTSPRGGLKNIPADARKILLINQIDSFPNWKTFYSHIDTLLATYSTVAFSVLEDQMLLEVHEKIAGIVLAAGGSSRFGEPKQLLDWFGEPLVKFVAENVKAAGCSPVVVVTGADHDSVSRALNEAQVEVVCNTSWQVGQSTSVRAAIQSLPGDIGAAIFNLVDQPLIPVELITALRKRHARNPASIILPVIDGKPANPVLFDRRVFTDLEELEGDVGGRALFDKYQPSSIPWNDPKSQMDVDTPEDYQKIRFANGSGD
ncbi:MAG TPA: putative selenium-dependent hydroxylase accessory protein YqeC [Chloroflexi bacterium]|nr:MAG: putative selenium-dependent hydroxylase accessory protein YqeC [Chloroflexota bacterium]HDN04430.1 putative selenium-dependent hydroxylase accessory protein YqeC [Chloroflexota bacterium]